jgi:hypothetical protein
MQNLLPISKKRGVMLSKPEHFAQMQAYMHLAGLERTLYVAKNKDDDNLHCERLKYDPTIALRLIEKARRIIAATVPPTRQFKPDFYLCKWCDFTDICHNGELPERNCRTCLHSTPQQGGIWSCANGHAMDDMRAHKPCHRHIPDNVPRAQIDVRGDKIIYEGWTDDGH